jgi:WD40 repeat protein
MSRQLLFSSLLLVLALPASSEQPAKVSSAEVERLIQQLGSDSFAKREAASKALDAIGEPALEALQKAITASGDAEVRRRAKMLAQAVVSRLYRQRRCFRGHSDYVYRVAFSPDGKKALSASADQTVRLWEVKTGKELRRLKGHTDLVYGVAFSPDGTQALSGSSDKTVRLWDV